MGRAKDIVVLPISASDAAALVKALHYSGKTAAASQVHLGVFLDGKCGGVMQFGAALQKSETVKLVKDTGWNNFLELNRMAFADWLPRNSESRALSYAFRFIKKHYPHIEWCVSFSDATQCGDGTIYRASGFLLTSIKKNTTIWRMPDGFVFADVGLRAKANGLKRRVGFKTGERMTDFVARTGAQKMPGFQLRYIYFLNPEARKRLTVPVIPFSEIEKRGAGMYRGKPKTSAGSSPVEHSASSGEVGGSTPTPALKPKHGNNTDGTKG